MHARLFETEESPPKFDKPEIRKVTAPRVIKTSMKSRPVIETNQLEEEKRARKEREKETEINAKEVTKAAKSLVGLSEFQFSNEDLENLEEFTLPRDAVGMGSSRTLSKVIFQAIILWNFFLVKKKSDFCIVIYDKNLLC